MNPIYKFSLIVGETEKQVLPNYKDDISKDYKLESNQRFYRADLSGKMTFQKSDFDYINSQPFETEFVFIIYKSNDNGVTWSEYWRGKFTKTDCKFDEDNKTCEVQPDLFDDYVDVLAGLEKEYNLIKLAPEITPILIQRRPLIQIYIPGDSVVSCFLGGDYWEQDANNIYDINALVDVYHFSLCNKLREVNLVVYGTPLLANGLYFGSLDKTTGYGSLYTSNSNGYKLIFDSFTYDDGNGGTYSRDECRLIRLIDDGIVFMAITPTDENAEFQMTAYSGTGYAVAEMSTCSVYARYLLDVDIIKGMTTYDIPTNDIVENNRNYRKTIGYAINVAYISGNYSNIPTEWGLAINGLYYQKPYSIYGQTYFPIARSTWRYTSIWFGFYYLDEY